MQKFIDLNFYNIIKNPLKNYKHLPNYINKFRKEQIYYEFFKSLRRNRLP